MPSKKSYNRFFIILQEDQKGYGVDINKTPSGYAKLEMRNDRAKTSFYVQDIKKQNGPYYMVLIAQGIGGTRELINLGQINIDEGGKADVSSEHEASNIANTNISMDKVQGAGICKINGTRINPVMVGFICGEELKNWATYPIAKSGAKVTKTTTMKTTKTTTIIEVPSEEISEKEVKKEATVVEEKKKDIVVEEKKKDTIEDSRYRKEPEDEDSNEVAKIEETSNVEDEPIVEGAAQDFDEYEEQIERLKEYRKKHNSRQCDDEHEHHDHNDKDEYPVGPMGEFFKNVIRGLEKVGRKDSIKNCTWYKAHVENLDAMYCENDYNKYSVIFYPMICYYPYIAKYKHFMIGYKCDDEGVLKYIIYAIPGTRALIDQPYEGKTGFVTFMSDPENSEKGHWLMYYDVKKNSVVVPVKTSK
ncbi:MAG: hypothetical protein E6344_18615 [Clostridium sp.]|nr:hypothetical protein [Clostridium sp.]MDU7085711.1 hypothetical protein [Clostridium sp.]